MKKLLNSNWLNESSTVQVQHQWKKCDTSANYTYNCGLSLAERQYELYLSQWYHIKWWQKFSQMGKKKGFEKDLPAGPYANCFVFILISNCVVFLVQFGINLLLWVSQKAESALAEAASAISGFEQLTCAKWTQNPLITYANKHVKCHSACEVYVYQIVNVLMQVVSYCRMLQIHCLHTAGCMPTREQQQAG